MKRLNLLVSSAFVALTFLSPQKTWGMENFKKESNTQSGFQTNSFLGDSITGSLSLIQITTDHDQPSVQMDFVSDGHLYHQITTENYRTSVHALRQEIAKLQQNIKSSGSGSEFSITQKEISRLTEMLDLQKIAFEKYGLDQSVAQQKIRKEIEECAKEMREDMERSSISKSGLLESQIKNAESRLQTCQKYLDSLEKSETTLRSRLETAQKHLKTLEQQASSLDFFKDAEAQKTRELLSMYESHVKGLCNSDIFSHHFPKVILEGLGVSSVQLDHVKTESLFRLFARTMELPYISLKTGEEVEIAYLNQVNVIKQNLTNRLYEDMVGLQMSGSLAGTGDIGIDLRSKNAQAEKYLNQKVTEIMITKDRDLESMKGILSSYGYKEQISSKFLETILNQSSCGLLGLYIASLEFFPVSSWNDARRVSPQGRLNRMKSNEEFSEIVAENIYLILGRHINIKILESIEEKLKPSNSDISKKPNDNDYENEII